jgi:hypothetical protein
MRPQSRPAGTHKISKCAYLGTGHVYSRTPTYTLSVRAVRARRPEVFLLCLVRVGHCKCCGMPDSALEGSGGRGSAKFGYGDAAV